MYYSKNKHCRVTSPSVAVNQTFFVLSKMAAQVCFRRFRFALHKLHANKLYMRSKAPLLDKEVSSLFLMPPSRCSWCVTRTLCSDKGRDSPPRKNDDNDDDDDMRTVQKAAMSTALTITQGPLGWLSSKVNLWLFKTFYDSEFQENEFLQGAKQAFCVVSDLLNEKRFDELEGILSDELASSLRNGRDTEKQGTAFKMQDILTTNIRTVQFGYVENERGSSKVIDIQVAYICCSPNNADNRFERQFGNVKIITPIPNVIFFTFRKFPESTTVWQVNDMRCDIAG